MITNEPLIPVLDDLYNLYQHIFYLCDPTLGKHNKLQLDFYNKK